MMPSLEVSTASAWVMSRPSNTMGPAMGSPSPEMALSSVGLPAPSLGGSPPPVPGHVQGGVLGRLGQGEDTAAARAGHGCAPPQVEGLAPLHPLLGLGDDALLPLARLPPPVGHQRRHQDVV